MFSKLFDSMYDGTLRTRSPWQALVTFQQMLILADPTGVVDMTAEALAIRTGIPLEIIQAGITALEAPDPDSRLPHEEGRRIVRLDDHRNWGWQIVNFVHYRNLQSNEARREYQKELMRKRRGKAKGSNVSAPLAPVSSRDGQLAKLGHAYASAYEGFDLFWKAYPKKVKKKDARKVWARLKPDEALRSKIHGALETQRREWDARKFIPDPTTWLNGERWEDEVAAPAAGALLKVAL
jgi:hypothetical protein